MQAILLFVYAVSVICVPTQSSVPIETSIASSAASNAKRPTQDSASPTQYSVEVQNSADRNFQFSVLIDRLPLEIFGVLLNQIFGPE